MKSSTYLKITLIATIALLLGFAGINYYVDPLFHYHKPQSSLQYPLWDERYMNDGITRNFDYDAVITGSSVTENFLTSRFDSYFGTNSIKVPYSGGTYCEIGDDLKRTLSYNRNVKYVMRGLDSSMLVSDKDSMGYEEYPDYLYDNNPFNDVYYLLNKDLYLKFTEYVFTFMRLGGNSTEFDVYKNWSGNYAYDGVQPVLDYMPNRVEKSPVKISFTETDAVEMCENLDQNVLSIVADNPDTEFFFFDPPYSILYFDDLRNTGKLDYMVDAWKLETEELLQYPNVHFFSYWNEYDIITNIGYYKDDLHYNQDISNFIIDSMAMGVDELTLDNYEQYYDDVLNFYSNYDYDVIFAPYMVTE